MVNGQKVWTSGANYADFCFLFCRTDRDAPRHKGISVLLVDMNTPGVSVRPLPEIVHPDQPDLNEVFFENVEVPHANLVGLLNDGWAMASGSLAHERGMVWLQAVLALEYGVQRVLDIAPQLLSDFATAERAVITDRVVASYVDSVAARALGYRAFAKLVRGGTAPEQALMKMFCTEAERRLNLVASELSRDHAVDAIGGLTRYGGGSWTERYFLLFGSTISAGTSEIQRNIVATQVLGLPRK